MSRMRLVGGASLLCTLMIGSALADDGMFVLDAGQLDRVTASGFVDVADAMALASGLGSRPALTDTATTSSVDPDGASTLASGSARGPEGSNVSVSILVSGKDGTKAVRLSAAGDTVAPDRSVVSALADGAVQRGGPDLVARGGAATGGGGGFSVSSTEFQGTGDGRNAAGVASSDGFSQQSRSASTSGLRYGSDGSQLGLEMQANGRGDTDGSALTTSEADLTHGTMRLTLNSRGEAVGQESSAKSSQIVKIGKEGMIVRSIGSATSSVSGGASSDSAISIQGVSRNAIQSTRRTIQLNGTSRSTSTAVIDLR